MSGLIILILMFELYNSKQLFLIIKKNKNNYKGKLNPI